MIKPTTFKKGCAPHNKGKNMTEELYQNLPGLRKSLDQYMTNMIKSYKEFKKRLNSKD